MMKTMTLPMTSEWEKLLASLCHLQQIVPDAVLVGGTAAALYVGHRVSFDHDHVLPDLVERFDDILEDLEAVAGWKTARINRPVQILEIYGSTRLFRRLIESNRKKISGQRRRPAP